MSGFSRETAERALAAGWEKREVTAAHAACRSLTPSPSVTDVVPFLAVLDRRWLLYRGLWCFRDLAMTYSFPPGEGEAVAYGDGSGNTANKACGYGVAVYEPGRPPRYHAEHGGLGSNNRAELLAIWRAFKAVPDIARPLHVRSDSEFAMGAVQDSSWRIKTPALRALVLTIRSDLVLRRVLGQRVEFEHVKGHNGTDGNEAADLLATLGRVAASGFPEPIFLEGATCPRCGAETNSKLRCGPCRKAADGWVKNRETSTDFDVLVMRPSPFGNPFAIGRDGSRGVVLAKHRAYLRGKPDLVAQIRRELVDKKLGCCCYPEPCHADTLAYVAAGGEP